MAKTEWISGVHTGVRWYKHPKRKYGRFYDRCFGIRYSVNKQRYEAILGWETEGWDEEKASGIRRKIVDGAKVGGPTTYKQFALEEAANEIAAREAKEVSLELDRKRKTSMQAFFEDNYLPLVEISNKPETVKKTKEHMKLWIGPVVADFPMKDIGIQHVERILINMSKAGRAPRTIQYVFITFGAVWTNAKLKGFVEDDSPSKHPDFVRSLPKVNNRKERFLTLPEENKLLEELEKRSLAVRNMAIISLDCGLRFGEISNLKWDVVDFSDKSLFVVNGKGDKNRIVPMTNRVSAVLSEIGPGANHDYVFEGRFGGRINKVSNSYFKAVKAAKLNGKNVKRLFKADFHTLRHTYASRLLKSGASLYDVSKLMGHSTISVTERYGHLVQDDLVSAVDRMEEYRLKMLSAEGDTNG